MRWIWLLFLAGCAAEAGLAADVPRLYEAEVIVADQSPGERDRAIIAAFRDVLGKLLPAREVASQGAQKLLSRASHYVHQYHYRTERRTAPESALIRKLVVKFDSALLSNALHARGLTVWEGDRPAVLVWLAMADERGTELVSSDSQPEAAGLLQNAATAKGLPLLPPLLDLTDRRLISAEAVMAGDTEAILQASARYDVDHVIAGSLVQLPGGGWEAEWRLLQGAEKAHWSGRSDTLPEALQLGMKGIYDRLIGEYALKAVAGKPGSLELKVEGVDNYEALARVDRYLEELTMVESITWVALAPEHVLLRLRLKSGASAFRHVIDSGPVLEALGDPISGRLTCRLKPAYGRLHWSRDE